MTISVFTDGGSRGNPGEGAVGIVINIKDQKSKIKTEENKIIKTGKRIGICTNNEAEYLAVIEALRQIKNEKLKFKNDEEKVEKVNFFLDSTLVCNQLNGKFKVKEPRMRELLIKAREQNSEADKLVNQALDTL